MNIPGASCKVGDQFIHQNSYKEWREFLLANFNSGTTDQYRSGSNSKHVEQIDFFELLSAKWLLRLHTEDLPMILALTYRTDSLPSFFNHRRPDTNTCVLRAMLFRVCSLCNSPDCEPRSSPAAAGLRAANIGPRRWRRRPVPSRSGAW